MVKKGQDIELEITQMAIGGQGLARLNEFAIFVDQAVPQDRVLARIIKKKKSWAQARVLEILEPSPLRVCPACRYSGVCGGCKWQFLGYDHQLRFKQQHVGDALAHIGLLKGIAVHPTLASELSLGYRNKMEFSCTTRRWLLPQEMGHPEIIPGMAVGLHVPGAFDRVLDIESCLLMPDLGSDILADVRAFIAASPLPVYGLKTQQGFWRFVVLRHSTAFDHWMVNIVTSAEQREHLMLLAETLVAKYPAVVSVVNNVTARKAGVAMGEYEVLLAGDSVIVERIGDFSFELSANSFFQTNTRGARRLYDVVKAYAGLTGREKVLDLYCGTGTIAIYLADSALEVIGLEIAESAVDDARRNCRRNQVTNCRFLAGDIRHTLSGLTDRPDVMVIDPPRAGMHEAVVKDILSMAPTKIIYVSCNPATMARDLALLKEMYRVVQVQPVDMFPHTFHIESVAQLEKIGTGSFLQTSG